MELCHERRELMKRDIAGSGPVLVRGEVDLFAHHLNLVRRADAQLDARGGGFENFNLDIAGNDDGFTGAAADHEQRATSAARASG